MNLRTGLFFAVVLAACAPAAATPDSGSDSGLMVPAGSCGQPGDMGNELGVGRFCTPGGRQCATAPQARICVVDLSPADMQWYCTRLCSADSDCGTDAVCIGDARGMGCLPARCAPPRPDAGTGTDAGAGTDAGTGDAG